MTLLEVMVAFSLALILLTLLHRFLVPVIQVSSRVSTRTYLYDQAVHSLTVLTEDIRESTFGSVSYRAPSEGKSPTVALCRRDGLTSKGYARYEREAAVFFVDRENAELRRRTWPPEPPDFSKNLDASLPLRFAPAELDAFDDHPRAGKLMATGVKEFQPFVEWPPSQVIVCRLVLEQDVPGKLPARFELERKTALRN